MPKRHYLEDLFNPRIDPSRRNALNLLVLVHEAKGTSSTEPVESRDDELARLVLSLDCANCGNEVSRPALYCSDLCTQTADVVRYVRRCLSDGRVERPDVQEGIGSKLLMLTADGYPKKARNVSEARRAEVFARDNFKCVLCGADATQIDHINGHSDDPSNLRAVCRTCNITEAFNNARTVTPESDPGLYSYIEGLFRTLADRIAHAAPLRACDDETAWNAAQKRLMPRRRIRFREVQEEREGDFQDVDGYLWHAMQRDD